MSEDLIRLLYEDPIRYFRIVLEDWFPTKMPWVHRGITALVLQRTDFLLNFGEEHWRDESGTWTLEDLLELCENFSYSPSPDDAHAPRIPLFEIEWEGDQPVAVHLTTSRFLEVMMPRGVSKTTLFNAIISFMIAYRLTKFTVYISEAQTHAERQLGNVRRVLEGNEKFRHLYGNLVPERGDPQKWTEDFIETKSGVAVQARGRGGQIRGANVDANRPDLLLLDDVEDKESVATPEQRNKTLAWLMGDVLPALPRNGGRACILGTLLHSESMMAKAALDPNFVVIRFGAMLENGKALWPWYMTEKKWLAERARYVRLGMSDVFYMEFQSTIHVDADARKFKPELWKIQVMERAAFKMTSMAIDPAISDAPGSDYCVIACGGMTDKGQIHVLDQWSKVGAAPQEQVDEYFNMHFRWLPDFHGVEAVAYQRALIHLLQEEMFRRSATHGNLAFFSIQPIKHGKLGKVERVQGVLAPRYSAGYITHQRHFAHMYQEALDWPNGKKDHLDATAMMVTLLDPAASFAGPELSIDLSPKDWAVIEEAHFACP